MPSLVIAEHDNNTLKAATLNTVSAAIQCAGEVHVLVAGANAGAAAAAACQIMGVAKVLHADDAGLDHGLAENVAEQVLAIAAGYSHILFAATASGKNIAPRVAARLDVAQLSDITKVDSADTFERPIYAGNAIATVQSLDADASSERLQATLADGTSVQVDAVLSAVGLRANTALASAAGIACERGVVVDAHVQTSAPHVYALGDCAQYASAGARVLPYVMPIMNAAKALAATLAGQPTELVFPLMPVAVKRTRA